MLVCCAALSTAKSLLTQDTLNYNIELSGGKYWKDAGHKVAQQCG